VASKDRAPSFQFYPRDFISSSAVTRMTPEERGGYIMLLCHAWDSDTPGVLPDDDTALASLSGLGRRWAKCRPAIARAFTVDGGTWMQQRMVAEREAQAERLREAVQGGKTTQNKRSPDERIESARRAARARWGTDATVT
jgi:uncharacterized protein YdaU (DUF1376 family)